jgi:hypothetical protein
MQQDSRYSVAPSNAIEGAYLLRFCGTPLGYYDTVEEALQAGIEHNQDRLAPRTRGVMQAGRISQGVRV